ncbi:hypothetical protein LTR67_010213 [Exophiala xenobiotica]
MAASKTMTALREVEDAVTAPQIVDMLSIPGTVIMRDVDNHHFIHGGHAWFRNRHPIPLIP